MNTPLLISFSGGLTSAFMTKYIVEHYGLNQDTHILFANTGKENEETLVFVNECAKRWNLPIIWVESDLSPEKGKGNKFKIVSFETASRKGEPFEALINKYGLPSRNNRMCTGILKIEPMEKYMRSLGHKKFITAIGMRADEPHRLREKWYPLFDIGVTQELVNLFWSKQDFTLGLKPYEGNCDLCHMKSILKRVKCIKDKPDRAQWWIQQEEKTKERFDNAVSVKELLTGSIELNQQLSLELLPSSLDISCFCGD